MVEKTHNVAHDPLSLENDQEVGKTQTQTEDNTLSSQEAHEHIDNKQFSSSTVTMQDSSRWVKEYR